MGDRFASHAVVGPDCREWVGSRGPDTDAAGHDWIDAVAALDDCDGYVVLMIDPQTAEVDAHGPYGGPDAAVAAERLRGSLDSEGLDDVMVRIVRLHLPARAS
ncbi:hypothetical protein LQ327_02825 [Actinomycetospora endophytica]|uniref:Uncharacterized protein n=1 Tax=Actinomycetospora endophytica TaxID=2291215 RepID=A0ABS8P270_9PSEU|nr:hypothetical protein [Actinomycetospora endophytica]MCD2192330.1 hypothetical protein [Actinomycetospora endophytica]